MKQQFSTLIILFYFGLIIPNISLSQTSLQNVRYNLSSEEILQLEAEQTVPFIKLNNYYLVHTNPIHPIIYNEEILVPLKQITRLFTGQSEILTGLGQASANISYNQDSKTATFDYTPVNQDMGKLCHMEFSTIYKDTTKNIYLALWFQENTEPDMTTPDTTTPPTTEDSTILIDLSSNRSQQHDMLVPLVKVLDCIGIEYTSQNNNSLVIESTRILFDGNIFLYSRHFGYFLDKVDKSSPYPVLGEYVIVEDNPQINLLNTQIRYGSHGFATSSELLQFELASRLPDEASSKNPEDYLTIYTGHESSVSTYGVGTPAPPCDLGCDFKPICKQISKTTYQCIKEVSYSPYGYSAYTLLRINTTTK